MTEARTWQNLQLGRPSVKYVLHLYEELGKNRGTTGNTIS
jgi:hypothetical protein